MSATQSDILESCIKLWFGPVLAEVSRLLLRGTCSIYKIKQQSELPLSQIKEALCYLVKYNLVQCRLGPGKLNATYHANIDNMKLLIRYPKFIPLIKRKFGEECESLIEMLVNMGYMTASDLIARVATILKDDKNITVSVKEIKDKFVSLVNAKYVKHFQDCNANEAEDSFVLPPIDVQALSKNMYNQGSEEVGDEGVYWTLNPDRFHQDIRDQLIVQAVKNKFDENVGELMRIMLEQMYIRTQPWEIVSNPIPISEIKEIIKKQNSHPDLINYFDQYVTILEEHSSEIITKCGSVGGGSYRIEMKKIMKLLVYEIVRYVIEERFGPEAARIYNLIVLEKYIEIDQIVNTVMLPSKDINLLIYELLENNFIFMSDMKKPTSNTISSSRSNVLFYTKLDTTVYSILELCYLALFKGVTRKENERNLNKQIIDKKRRVDTIVLAMRAQNASEEQLADIEDMITPPEYELLNKISYKSKKLDMIEMEVDDTIFLLDTYLKYH